MDNSEESRILRLLDSVEKDPDINEALRVERDKVRHRLFPDENMTNDFDNEEADDELDDVYNSDHDSDTSQSGEEDEIEERLIEELRERENSPQLEYTGKDKTSKWNYFLKPRAERGRRSRRNIVTHLPGPIHQAKYVTTPIETDFFTEDDLQNIVAYTNIWIRNKRDNYSRDRDAKDVDIVELRAVIGLLYLAGTLKENHTNLKDLWASDGTGVERFRLTVSLSRFTFLLRAIRFDNITD